MIIKGWNIAGYGVFSDAPSPEFGRGLNVILGPNEAGKSTLLSFIRHTLFGYPAKNSRSDVFVPSLKGGALGGRIYLEDADGNKWTVERFHSRKGVTVTAASGRSCGEGELSELLGHLDVSAYRSVFGFDLADLASLDALSDDKIKGRLMSAGISGAGDSADKAVKYLDARLALLLKDRGAAKLNSLADKYKELLKKREAAVEQLSAYADLAARQGADEAVQKEMAATLDRRRVRAEQLKAFIKWKAVAVRLLEARALLSSLETANSFPEDGLKRFEAHAANIRGWQERIGEIDLAIANESERLQNLATDARWVAAAPALATLDREAGEVKAKLSELSRLQEEILKTRDAVRISLSGLGDGWDEGKVASFGADALRISEARRHDRLFTESEARLQSARSNLAEARGRLKGFSESPPAKLEAKPDAAYAVVMIASALGTALLSFLFMAGNAHWGYLFSGTLAVVGLAFSFRGRTHRITPESAAREAAFTQAKIEETRCVELEKVAKAALEEVGQSWSALTMSWGFGTGPTPSPDATIELLGRIEQCKALLAEIVRLNAIERELLADISLYEQRAQMLLSETPLGAVQEVGARLIEAVRSAALAAESEVRREGDAGSARDALTKLEKDRLVLVHKVQAESGLAEKLLSASGAAGEEEFRAIAARMIRRMAIEDSISNAVASLKSQFGDDFESSPEGLELFSSGAESWSTELTQTQSSISEMTARLADLNRTIGANGALLSELERSITVNQLDAELEAARSEGRNAAREWLVTSMAKELLKGSLDRFARERQPGVLAEASRLFSMMTGGRYARVLQPPDDTGIRVERADGALCDVVTLSRGTREELYLSIRLGLAADFASRGADLPILADDIFVNFDPARAKAAMESLCRFAESRQAIVFTCHPETVVRFKEACPDVRIFHLDRETGGFKSMVNP